MKVISVNIGERRKVKWRSRTVETGIFKFPIDEIILAKTDVENDHVVDRKYHGGSDKACYIFSADDYECWKIKYPDLEWNWGMFGENITIEGLKESEIFIGSQYSIGTAIVEVSEPRQPCFKLGIRFNTQKVLKDFISNGKSGVYLRVLKQGVVTIGDEFKLINKGSDISIQDVFELIYKKHKNSELIKEAIQLDKLAHSTKDDLGKI